MFHLCYTKHMKLKDLLLSRKAGFIKYIIGAFIPILNNLAMTFIFAFLLGLIQDQTYFKETLLFVSALAIVSILLQVLSRYLRIQYMRDILMDIRQLAFKKIMNKSYQQYATQSKDVYLSHLVNDINLFEQDFFLSILNVMVMSGTFIVSIIILAIIDPLIALMALAVSILMTVITKLFEKRNIDLKQKVSTANEEFSVQSANTISGLEILKLNQVEDRFLDGFKRKVNMIENLKQRYNLLTESQRVTLESIGFIFMMSVLLVVSNRLATGQTLVEVGLTIQIGNSVVWNLVYMFPLLNKAKASESIYNKITQLDERDDSQQGTQAFNFNHTLSIHQVSFAYPDEPQRLVLKDISLNLEKGKKYLLKGTSGAGKTTFLQLLSKVYQPTLGTIELDGVAFKDISQSSFNEHIAFIYQSVFLFNDSIRNNITLFDDALSEQEIMDAIKKAGLSELIERLPDGLDTILEENGKNLSGGERQRVSIARALIKKAEILFVDEATSSLDSELGQAIEQTLLNLDQMVIAISHRTYQGVTNQYDGVISINNQQAYLYNTTEYFELGGITE